MEHDSSGLQKISNKDTDQSAPFRRSLYILARRNYPLNFLETFDYPKVQVNCTKRTNSVTPLQSLTLMNDPFVLRHASKLAQRVLERAAGNSKRSVELAYLMTLSRPPAADETRVSQDHLDQQEKNYRLANAAPGEASEAALTNLCQTLLATNEFIYLD